MSQNIERPIVAVPRTQKVTNPHLDMDADIESDSCKSITDSETHPDAHLAPVPLHHDEENESRGTKDGSTSVAGTVPMTKSSTLLSKITTVQIDDSLIVSSNQRRGLFARLCLIPEYQDSRNMPASLRRFIVFIIAFCAMLGPMGTSILLPASDNAVADLHTTITILNVAIGVYLITLGVIPLWWSNFSERHGRRSVYIISFIMYLGFTVGCALSKDVNKLIGFRVLSGGCAASVQSVGAGTIGDLYPITKRGSAMGLFYLGPLAGPLLSPIIGGAITSNKKFGWRATQWFLVCLSFGCCLLIVFFLPETLRKQDNRESIRKILRERRRNKIHKNDEENTVGDETETDIDKEMDDHSNETMATRNTNNNTGNNTNNTSNPVMKITGESRRPSVDSIDSNAISENDCAVEAAEDVDDQQVEHLQKLLSRISTRPSFNSARSDLVTRENQHTCPENFDGANNFGTGEPQEDIDTEEPVMDSVVPLSKVQTNNTNNFIERKRTKRSESFAEELEHVENIDNAGFYKKFMHYLKIYGYGPLKAFAFIRYPPVFLAMMYSGPCFAVLYVQNMTLTYKYSRDPYNFSSVLVGLVYIPNSVTYFIASIWGGKFNDYLLRKKIEKYGVVAPEARFGINVYIAAVLLPISLLITGWCLEYGEQWVTPLIGTAIFGFAQMIVIGVTVTYLADCLPGKGATGIALNNFIRMIMAAGVSFATEPLIKAIGTGVLFSICAGVCAVLSILIVLIIKFGDYWRETYDLEVLYDIVDG